MQMFVVFAALISVAFCSPVKLRSYCASLDDDFCDLYPRHEVCDSAGTVYRNKCDFLTSWCKNDSLVMTECDPKQDVRKSYICQFYEKEDCSRHFHTWKNKCDTKGNQYKNPCEYNKAWCDFKTLKLVDCPEKKIPSKPIAPAPLPTVLFCEFYKQNNCTLDKFGRMDVCDQHGNGYRNKCEFRQAWCHNTSLEIREDCVWNSTVVEGSGESNDAYDLEDSMSKDSASNGVDKEDESHVEVKKKQYEAAKDTKFLTGAKTIDTKEKILEIKV